MLPSFPNLPTDNLYKFMALSGFFTTILSVGFILISSFQFEMKKSEYMIETSHLQAELNKLESYGKLVGENDELYQRFWDAKEKAQELEKRVATIRPETLISSLNMARLLAILGLLLAFRGFYLWKVKVQNPMDEILLLNIAKAKLEFENLGKQLNTD